MVLKERLSFSAEMMKKSEEDAGGEEWKHDLDENESGEVGGEKTQMEMR